MSHEPERRTLEFKSLDEVLADAERLASGTVRTTGNHSFAKIMEHLARSHDMTTGRLEVPKPPFFMRLMMPVIKHFVLKDQPLKPGIKLPAKSEPVFWPDEEFSVEDTLAHLKESIEHYKQQGPMPKHPMFGPLTREQHDMLHCRHAELHLSFVHPVE